MNTTLRIFLVVLVCLAMGFGCGRGGRDSIECFDNGDCNDELGNVETVDIEACRDGDCDNVDCLSSADCVVGNWCDVEDEDYSCREGCRENTDCFAGQECSDGACVIYGCRSTVLDCGFNEVCNEDTGVCDDASGLQCTGCDSTGHYIDDQGTPDPCDDEIAGHQLCGGDGNFCGPDGDNTVCWVACAVAGDPTACPSGFQCANVSWTPTTTCDPVTLGPVCLPTSGYSPTGI